MSQSEQHEEALFEAALRLSSDQRAAYLDQTCAGNEDLRRHVEVLVAAFDRAGAFMKEPATPVSARNCPLPLTEKPGDRIGRYKLLEQIGEGGCGVVYVAEQEEPVRRRVALKVIKLGMDTKQVIARFDAERQALAMMDHPNIAKIFDAGVTDAPVKQDPHPASCHPLPSDGRGAGGEGTASSQPSTLNSQLSPGRPYFVMELVRGIKITDYCDQQQLAPRERLDLFIQVCRAIQHAHQKGIIHRDIKPSNILVTSNDGVPVPKVIDFGIAKATQGRLTDQTVYTAFEQFIGTPAYMSPEQAEMSGLDIDTRSDIYSLGVLLYELLTGKTPFDAKELLAAGLDEMRRTIREVEPIKPSKVLERQSKLRVERSTSAGVQARSTLNSQLKLLSTDLDWIVMKCLEKDRTRRYETANGLATDISRHLNNEPIVARPPSRLYRFQKSVQRNKLAFGAATAVALALVIGLAVSMAMFFKAQAEKKKAQTEAAKSHQVAQFFKDMVDATAPSVTRGRDATLLREMLDRTAQRISRDLLDQPEVEVEVRRTLGVAYQILKQYVQAEAMFRHELAVARKHFGNEHPEVAKSLNGLGFVLAQQDKLDEAESLFREALELHRKLRRSLHPDLASSLNGLAGVLESQGKLAEAEALFREALAIRRKLSGNDNHMVSNVLGNLAGSLARQGKLAEAEAAYRESLVIARNHHEGDHDTPSKLKGLAAVVQQKGELAEAEALFREALTMESNIFGEGHSSVAKTLNRLVALLRQEGKTNEAKALLEGQTNSATGKKNESR